ncbi:protein translocase subunit SecA-like [Plectropomus leopardus]|uniref:protein translocase subunit SecA-like n=1 Tax=Plectropomus leopardus TaxID=160734 RepID=UPI001C4DC03F|nr:protein translocase subunit SecA-like [Plectropomus leopardus]
MPADHPGCPGDTHRFSSCEQFSLKMAEFDADIKDEELFKTLIASLSANRFMTPKNNEKILLKKLQGLVTNIKWSPADAAELLNALLKRFEFTTKDRSHLVSWMLNTLHCIEINCITPTWRCQTGKTLIELVQDKTVTDEDLKTRIASDTEKQLDEILEEIRQKKLNQIEEKLLRDVRDIVSSVDKDLTSGNNGSRRSHLQQVLLKLCRAAAETHFRPRLTQMVSWCIMALSKSGRLIQVGTGEGKSCIVAMFAAFRAMEGQKVDIMSSSSVLAERDLKEWQEFYEDLNISVSCNTNKQETDLKKCYESQVVYGTVEQFAGDWLRHHFHREDVLGQRKFECAIVDEVDSLMLDKGLHVVYLSTSMPALQHLNPLLAFIWATANQYSETDTECTQSVQRAVEAKIKDALCYTPCELSQDKCRVYVPGFLKNLVESKLKVWIENAFYAQTMTMGHEYIIEEHGVVPVDYSCTGVVENHMKWTDGLQQFLEMKHMKSKLSDMTAITNYMSSVGLLQKYGDQIFGISGTLGQQAETETLQKIYEGIKTCQIPSFKRRKLFEVEGVIVDDEKDWIEKICKVVTAQTNPTLYRDERAVLLICETINRAKILYRALGDKVTKKNLYINNNMDNTAIFAKKVEAGEVIIATNLAGRGTDLQVSDQVKKAGGLFVVQTFLPKNARVEAQAFGRTARQGSPGSAQLIVCANHLSKSFKLLALIGKLRAFLENMVNDMLVHLFVVQFRSYQKSHSDEVFESLASTALHILTKTSDSEMKTIKDARNDNVKKALASYEESDIPKIKKKEELFSHYLDTLDEVYKSSNNRPADSDLSALNEFWGMWLLTNFNENDSIMVLKDKLREDLKTAREKLKQRESPSSNLHHYTAFGNDLHQKGQIAESINMYTKAIQEDHCWAAIAYYNRAFATLSQHEHHDSVCIIQAQEDLQNALKSVELYVEQTEAICRYTTEVNDLHSDSISRFDIHMIAKYQMLFMFKANINEAIKTVDRAIDLGRNVKVSKYQLFLLVPLVYFVPLISTQSLSQIWSRDPLKVLKLISNPSFDIFNELECLKSLGLTHVYTLDTQFSLGGFLAKKLGIRR